MSDVFDKLAQFNAPPPKAEGPESEWQCYQCAGNFPESQRPIRVELEQFCSRKCVEGFVLDERRINQSWGSQSKEDYK